MNILQQADRQVIFIENDPLLYEGAAELVEDVSRAIGGAAKKAAVLLYSQETDPPLEGADQECRHNASAWAEIFETSRFTMFDRSL